MPRQIKKSTNQICLYFHVICGRVNKETLRLTHRLLLLCFLFIKTPYSLFVVFPLDYDSLYCNHFFTAFLCIASGAVEHRRFQGQDVGISPCRCVQDRRWIDHLLPPDPPPTELSCGLKRWLRNRDQLRNPSFPDVLKPPIDV